MKKIIIATLLAALAAAEGHVAWAGPAKTSRLIAVTFDGRPRRNAPRVYLQIQKWKVNHTNLGRPGQNLNGEIWGHLVTRNQVHPMQGYATGLDAVAVTRAGRSARTRVVPFTPGNVPGSFKPFTLQPGKRTPVLWRFNGYGGRGLAAGARIRADLLVFIEGRIGSITLPLARLLARR